MATFQPLIADTDGVVRSLSPSDNIGGIIIFSDTAPSTSLSRFWYDTSHGALFVSYSDGSSSQWVEITSAGGAGGAGGGGSYWGSIAGTLSDQTDLKGALDDKSGVNHNHDGIYVKPADLASVATSGNYDDLLNKPRRAWRELIVADGVTPPTFLLNEAGTDYLYSEFIYE